MNDNLDKKIDFKEKIIDFYKKNKSKIYFAVIILIVIFISIFFININQNKKNSLISEKYIQADLFLSNKNTEKAKEIFEEIIFSENKFYSILALNTILEEDLEKDKNKILQYFEILENIDYSKKKDLIILKKALFLSKNSETKLSNNLLQKLIDENSKLKDIAKDLILN